MIKRLDYDSDFFGYEIGCYNINSLNGLKLEFFKQDDFKLIYVFSKEPIYLNDFLHVDTKVVFQKPLFEIKKNDVQSNTCEVFDINKHNVKKLEYLTIESGKYSRFKIDANFHNNEFERLYLEWIFQSYQRKNALDVLIYIIEQEIAGFITITKKSNILSDIGLVAVDPNYQGKGIGSILIKSAEKYSIENNYKEIQVVTQETNQNAIKLYLKNGFRLINRTYIYHYWSKN